MKCILSLTSGNQRTTTIRMNDKDAPTMTAAADAGTRSNGNSAAIVAAASARLDDRDADVRALTESIATAIESLRGAEAAADRLCDAGQIAAAEEDRLGELRAAAQQLLRDLVLPRAKSAAAEDRPGDAWIQVFAAVQPHL